ncbi:uncharacterized protein Tco025E_05319 [Trypanosoma conorhini]|uniref:Uncharacterized protein n=1 Tax=Trypanosoma conorhini TaxID=83891 RepID=A0A3R7MJ65_9TRYP|nr:uncharacterized protein Tco025E_05319 [Trypanosoma conorhini]RNF16038.1 hypothetical protein Tco025E_05319 [Trypanosoma conorhini]
MVNWKGTPWTSTIPAWPDVKQGLQGARGASARFCGRGTCSTAVPVGSVDGAKWRNTVWSPSPPPAGSVVLASSRRLSRRGNFAAGCGPAGSSGVAGVRRGHGSARNVCGNWEGAQHCGRRRCFEVRPGAWQQESFRA